MAEPPNVLPALRLGGRLLTFHVITGIVVAEKTWAETHVSSSGGGGCVGRHGGYVSPPKIRSRIITRRQIWLREPDGRDTPLDLTSSSIAVREGQVLSACWATASNAQTGPYVLYENHSTGAHEIVHFGCSSLVTGKLLRWAVAVAGSTLIFSLAVALLTGIIFWWVATALSGAFIFWGFRVKKAEVAKLLSHLDLVRVRLDSSFPT